MDIARAAGLRYAERVARLCARASDEPVAGVILHGSLVLGDYVPDRSDVDVLAVVESEERRHSSKSAAAECALSREPSLPAVH